MRFCKAIAVSHANAVLARAGGAAASQSATVDWVNRHLGDDPTLRQHKLVPVTEQTFAANIRNGILLKCVSPPDA